MKKFLLAAAVATFGLAAAPSAMAQTSGAGDAPSACTTSPCTDADMNVTVTITDACQRIEVADLDFGIHPMLMTAGTVNRDAQTTVDVLCNTGRAYTVALDYGINVNGTSQRRVRGENDEMIDYALFKDAARTQPWGMDAVEPGSEVAGTGNNAFQTLPIYGQLLQTQSNTAGVYTDLVTAILNF